MECSEVPCEKFFKKANRTNHIQISMEIDNFNSMFYVTKARTLTVFKSFLPFPLKRNTFFCKEYFTFSVTIYRIQIFYTIYQGMCEPRCYVLGMFLFLFTSKKNFFKKKCSWNAFRRLRHTMESINFVISFETPRNNRDRRHKVHIFLINLKFQVNLAMSFYRLRVFLSYNGGSGYSVCYGFELQLSSNESVVYLVFHVPNRYQPLYQTIVQPSLAVLQSPYNSISQYFVF